MRYRTIGVGLVAGALSLATIGAIAQQNGPSRDQTTQQQQYGMMGQGMGPGMMGNTQQGWGMMSGMFAHHQQMTELMNKLVQSMTALQNEKDPKALQSELAEHKLLLEQMQKQMTLQGGMMQNFASQARNCPFANSAPSQTNPSK